MCPRTHPAHPSPTDFSSKHRAKTVPLETDQIVADVDAAFMQKMLHIPERQRELDIHHHCQADKFGTSLEVLEWVAFCHSVKLDHRPVWLNKIFL